MSSIYYVVINISNFFQCKDKSTPCWYMCERNVVNFLFNCSFSGQQMEPSLFFVP